ncbi:hypothetical protein DVH05_002072 [Phytophthora capsici]|nr:hypothetical protein DVH05_002072 [Phytophthora capsici]
MCLELLLHYTPLSHHRPHSSRHGREDPEERDSPPRYRRHAERERSRDYGGERSYGRPDEVEEFHHSERRSQSGYYESRSRGEERVPRECMGRGADKSPQEYRRYGRPEMSSSRHGSRRGPGMTAAGNLL